MKRTKNEQGYALLLVLLLIVFITVITAVFLRGSISNAKQEINTDTSHLTYVAAETGVDYFKTLYSNQYYENVASIEESAKQFLANRLKIKDNKVRPPTSEDYNETRKHAATLLKGKLNVMRDRQDNSLLIRIDESYGFMGNNEKPTQVVIQQDGITIVVTGSVIGKNTIENKQRILSFEQTFLLPSFDSADSGTSNGGEGGWNYPGHGATSKCSDSSKIDKKKCVVENSSTKLKEIDNSTVYFPNGYTSSVKDIDIEDSKVYVKGDFNVDKGELEVEDSIMTVEGSVKTKKEIEIEDSRFYVKGSVTSEDEIDIDDSYVNIGSNLHATKEIEIEDSTVKVGGSLTTNDELEVEDSDVEVGGTLTVAKDFELEDSNMVIRGSAALRGKVEIKKSYLYIGGALDSSGSKFEVKNNSKVCVNGGLTILKKADISSSSIVYHYGPFAYYGEGEKSSRIQQLNYEDFQKKCPVTSSTPSAPEETGIKWPSPSLDVEYK